MSEKHDGLLSERFTEYKQMMFKIAFGILNIKPDAEDAVQDAFLWFINDLEKVFRTSVIFNPKKRVYVQRG